MFWRLTYISTVRSSDFAKDLAAILKQSREHNALHALTGVLLVAGGSFYQTIEGGKIDVDGIFERIKKDPRHDGLIILQGEASTTRAFGAWSMAHRDLPPDHEIANMINQVAAGDRQAHRTKATAEDTDILITSFLSV